MDLKIIASRDSKAKNTEEYQCPVFLCQAGISDTTLVEVICGSSSNGDIGTPELSMPIFYIPCQTMEDVEDCQLRNIAIYVG